MLSQSVQRQFHPTAAIRETVPRPTPAPLSPSPTAPPAVAHSRSLPRTPLRHGRWPSAGCPKMNAHRPRSPDRLRAASTSSCASIQTPASPNSKSHSGDTPLRPEFVAPFRKTPPSRLHSAPPPPRSEFHLLGAPSPTGSLRPPPANTPTHAAVLAQLTPQAIPYNFLLSDVAIPRSSRS